MHMPPLLLRVADPPRCVRHGAGAHTTAGMFARPSAASCAGIVKAVEAVSSATAECMGTPGASELKGESARGERQLERTSRS